MHIHQQFLFGDDVIRQQANGFSHRVSDSLRTTGQSQFLGCPSAFHHHKATNLDRCIGDCIKELMPRPLTTLEVLEHMLRIDTQNTANPVQSPVKLFMVVQQNCAK
jgi:hypothetical protein